MSDQHQLGGTRQSSPLDNERSYPLTNDEYLTIRENLSIERFSNWEAFLLSTLITTLISGIVIWFTGSFYTTTKVAEKEIIAVNYYQIVTVIVYGAITLGALVGFIIFQVTKSKAKPAIKRLDDKITKHLNKADA